MASHDQTSISRLAHERAKKIMPGGNTRSSSCKARPLNPHGAAEIAMLAVRFGRALAKLADTTPRSPPREAGE
jgi:hypothetical protein